MTSPIVSEVVEESLPPLANYDCSDQSGHTDVRVQDYKAQSLWVAILLHQLDMTLSHGRAASESLVPARHARGPLLSYFLAPGTGNLCGEEVVDSSLGEPTGA